MTRLRLLSPMSDWYVYIIRCGEGTLYTGIATDVARRYDEHKLGGSKGSRYLRGRTPLELVFTAKVGERSLALKTERVIKRLPKSLKERLVSGAVSIRELVDDERSAVAGGARS